MYPKKELAQIIISACRHFNIETVVISPGSRNAPPTIGFTNDKDFDTISIVDERCAAFFALGVAQNRQKPVAIVCTQDPHYSITIQQWQKRITVRFH